MAKKPKKAELIPVLKELFSIIKPAKEDGTSDEPPIDGTIKEQLSYATKAAGLLEKGDEISTETAKFFTAYEISHGATVPPSKEEKAAAAAEAKTKAAEAKAEAKTKKAPKVAEDSYGRASSIVDAIKEKCPATREELVEAADKLYVKNTGKSTNERAAKWPLRYAFPVLEGLGLVEEKKDGKISVKGV